MKKKPEKCGICDICTGRNQSDQNEETLERYRIKITRLLIAEPLPFEEILKAFALKKHEMVTAALDYMAAEGFIAENEKGEWFVV